MVKTLEQTLEQSNCSKTTPDEARRANPDNHCERSVTFVRLSQVWKQEIRQKERRQMVDLPAGGIIRGEHHATWEQKEERWVSSQRCRAERKMIWPHTLRSMDTKGTRHRQLVPIRVKLIISASA